MSRRIGSPTRAAKTVFHPFPIAFFAALAGPCAYSTAIDIGGRHVPQVFGVVNMCGNFAAASCPILVGWLFERTANWNLVLLLFAGVYFAASVFWVFLKPERKL